MTAIGIAYDQKEGQFVMRMPPGLSLAEHNGDIWLSYDQALKLHATLGELLKTYQDERSGETGGIRLV